MMALPAACATSIHDGEGLFKVSRRNGSRCASAGTASERAVWGPARRATMLLRQHCLEQPPPRLWALQEASCVVPYRGLVTVCLAAAVAFAGPGHGPPAGLPLPIVLPPDSLCAASCTRVAIDPPKRQAPGVQRDPNNV